LDCDPTDGAALDALFEERRAETIGGRPSRFAVLKEDGRFVGCIGAYAIARTAIGLSYWIDAGCHGRGHGREAIGIFSEWALKAYRRSRIQANVGALNKASIAALRAAGFREVEAAEDPVFGKATDRLFFVWPSEPRRPGDGS
jgi:RimJ/RimL family protein N-acetyltransferase